MDKIFLTLDDVCRILHISRTTAYLLVRDKKLDAVKCGRKWLIPESAVETYLSSQD